MAYHLGAPAAQLQADFGDLGGLAGTGLARDDDHLVIRDGLRNLILFTRDRKGCRVGDGRDGSLDQAPRLVWAPGAVGRRFAHSAQSIRGARAHLWVSFRSFFS